VLSCLTLAIACEDKEVTTVEGLANGGRYIRCKQAFVDLDASMWLLHTGADHVRGGAARRGARQR